MPQFTPINLTVGTSDLTYVPSQIDRNRVASYVLQDSSLPLFGRPRFTYGVKPSTNANGNATVRLNISEPIVQTTEGVNGNAQHTVLRTGRVDLQFQLPVKSSSAEREQLLNKAIAYIEEMRQAILDVEPVWA